MKRFLAVAVVACALAPMILAPTAFGVIIVDDSWADGGRNNGSDTYDTDWWYSTGSTAIEVGTNYLGLVTGGSGRGIHGTFSSQSLGVGDTLTATFTFTTPATVGTGKASAFRVGFFDTTGHDLARDLTASSSSPNAEYNNLYGYMMDLDVNLSGASTNNVAFRERSNMSSGQLMASTSDYTSIGTDGGAGYSFATANTTYKGILSLTRSGTDTLDLSMWLYQGATLLTTYTVTDESNIVSTFGALAFHVNSSTFGSSGTPYTADNGIDFSNIKIEYIAIPEPSTLVLAAMGLAGLIALFRNRR
jgi:hypothetical protein